MLQSTFNTLSNYDSINPTTVHHGIRAHTIACKHVAMRVCTWVWVCACVCCAYMKVYACASVHEITSVCMYAHVRVYSHVRVWVHIRSEGLAKREVLPGRDILAEVRDGAMSMMILSMSCNNMTRLTDMRHESFMRDIPVIYQMTLPHQIRLMHTRHAYETWQHAYETCIWDIGQPTKPGTQNCKANVREGQHSHKYISWVFYNATALIQIWPTRGVWIDTLRHHPRGDVRVWIRWEARAYKSTSDVIFVTVEGNHTTHLDRACLVYVCLSPSGQTFWTYVRQTDSHLRMTPPLGRFPALLLTCQRRMLNRYQLLL